MSDIERLPNALGAELEAYEGDYHDDVFGEYHPSQLSGCPLGAFLDFMMEKEVPMNQYIFSGTAVHYYLQETGILKRALHNIGHHWIDTSFEVGRHKKVAPGVKIVGRADILCHDGEDQWVIDLKYSSIRGQNNQGRMMKYARQVNTYCGMMGGDKWGLLIPYSRADHVPDEIDIFTNDFHEEDWEEAKEKAVNIHEALDYFGYPEGERWDKSQLKQQGEDFWEDVMQFFDGSRVPSYDGELKYSDRDEWVMPYMHGWEGNNVSGLKSFKK